jgi:hypothetical protein
MIFYNNNDLNNDAIDEGQIFISFSEIREIVSQQELVAAIGVNLNINEY